MSAATHLLPAQDNANYGPAFALQSCREPVKQAAKGGMQAAVLQTCQKKAFIGPRACRQSSVSMAWFEVAVIPTPQYLPEVACVQCMAWLAVRLAGSHE